MSFLNYTGKVNKIANQYFSNFYNQPGMDDMIKENVNNAIEQQEEIEKIIASLEEKLVYNNEYRLSSI